MNYDKLPDIEIGYDDDDKIILFQRMIGVAEQDSMQERLDAIDAKDPEKYQKEFELAREALGTFAYAPPAKYAKDDAGETVTVPLIDGAQTATAALEERFKERTPRNERLIRGAFKVFQNALNPNFRLLQRSVS